MGDSTPKFERDAAEIQHNRKKFGDGIAGAIATAKGMYGIKKPADAAPAAAPAPSPSVQGGLDGSGGSSMDRREKEAGLKKGGPVVAKNPFPPKKGAKADAEDAKEMSFMRKNKAPKAMIAAEKAEEPAFKCGGMVKKAAGGMVRRGYGKARGA